MTTGTFVIVASPNLGTSHEPGTSTRLTSVAHSDVDDITVISLWVIAIALCVYQRTKVIR
jgi:hypothetical protein